MITILYAGLLALFYFYISFRVIKARRKNQISTGYGPNNEIRDIVSSHANFAAYIPLQIIIIYLLEASGHIPFYMIHILGICILVGRFFHFQAFSGEKMIFKYRVLGMQLTLYPLVAMGIMGIYVYIRTFF